MNQKIQMEKLKQILANIQSQIDVARDILAGSDSDIKQLDTAKLARERGGESLTEEGRIVEGVYDGEKMIGPDGKQYIVPPNYASKSKLVEGDMLKLTITAKGSFLFKQIGPVNRNRVVGTLYFDKDEKEYYGRTADSSYKLLTASVTYFKGETDDEVIMLVPEDSASKWAAVENVIKNLPTNVIPEHEDLKQKKAE